ncbi:restriction endonuclease subunit S [Pseudomonas moraviensis]|uniref:restriction endonuclease subunit S n=1 Tax=Pseudomonas moraviensis TaxID=321662 RepID=UPI000936176A|nr:restriction endonuclease subunit S [Pseudomonas moraviensis]OJT51558.1 hypothetical protein BSZ28_10000 [Pseudomonas moraviensis]
MPNSLVSLGEIVDVFSGFAWKAAKFNNEGNGVPVIRIQNIGQPDSGFVYWDEQYQDRFLVNQGDVLLSLSGSFRITVWDGPTGLLNQRVVKLTPRDGLDVGYFRHFMQTQLREIEAMGRHALVNNVSVADLKNIQIPLPPYPEQRRIAAILDKADALLIRRRAASAKLDRLLQSVFLEMFGDPVTNPKEWPDTTRLGEIADICSGITKGRKTTSEIRSVPYLAVANVQDRHLKLENVKTIEATEQEINRYKLLTNDLLLTEGGDPDKLGRGALWDASIPDCIHQNHVFRVRITSSAINPIFLNWLVGSARGKRYFLGVAKQTTGIASINMTQLKNFPLLTPPVDLQELFAVRVSRIESHREMLDSAENSAGDFFKSLQQQAFEGNL